jgi:twitching motility two-component system response regulator PilH
MVEITRVNSEPPCEKKKRVILVVDSDAAHLYYTGILLQRLDYEIHTLKTAEDALEFMDVTLPALILTETTLRGVDGMELLKTVKRNPRTKSIPVIMYSLSWNSVVKETCLREGCAAFLQKPIDPDVLYAAIQQATEATPRRYIRLSTCLSLAVGDEAGAGDSMAGNCITALSENGVYINTPTPRAIGARLPLTIFLGKTKIKADGLVLYSFNLKEGPLHEPGMGIKFIHIKPEDQSLIRAFIKKELTQDLSRK